MGFIKRIASLLFFLAAAVVLVVYGLTTHSPWAEQIRSFISNWEVMIAYHVCLGITALGLLVHLFAALRPRRPRTLEVVNLNGGRVTVTRNAIASQVTHVLEAEGDVKVKKVIVTPRRKNVDVLARLAANDPINLTVRGPQLHEALVSGLSRICGDRVRKANLEFVDAASDKFEDDLVEERTASEGSLVSVDLAKTTTAPTTIEE